MKNLLFIILSTTVTFAQTAFKNMGTIQLHDDANIAFHTNLINDGSFENNKGTVGFYSDTEKLIVSGVKKATFYNVEIDVVNNLELESSLALTNELSFINGKVVTDKNNLAISLEFNKHRFYAGENDNNHINGYAMLRSKGTDEFIFPIGDSDNLRPMILPIQNKQNTFLGAYFYEDPNMPTTFSETFLTDSKQVFIDNVSKTEFWDLNGASNTSVTLTWNDRSDVAMLSKNSLEKLRVVGWSNINSQWEDLGAAEITGNLTEGSVTSNSFVPDNYQIITLASGFADSNNINLLISPNGDTKNETLVFKNLTKYDSNSLEIFNRWGNLVYNTENYKNDWTGESTGSFVVNSKDKLPAGTYFYILKYVVHGVSKTQKGWVYINR
ncbi:gliding motility-associated C-terminal domain-containing protein [Tenacibaculum dicentrarchi]|uniref:gliding motility-associated C-terminal domain-containing protein n=1 Tax=Tenacibaculum dicentrarchi TaxID=669041 RepID=UPI000C613FE5|nr:gliding motility-associated C-terminal domain-containing protein [Tenacibaculum dicentrarchi]MCD8407513.1 gliding motility-associated C-terminal domain-containing protein [Tenacibaculum dicentrarchi]MCD8414745.1 gliding motility-associated C-terminal domain-containing protein [Tenacibaculum dicentrarchi]MCD8419736.1 gliding motility-associated C-terminal domain-containing protein [Tenacibaculum dicentrarchi]MCD8424887.1 gliding motility-associated C-terminal domain-containing protein [Tenaci